MIRLIGRVAAPVVLLLAMQAAFGQGPGGQGPGGQAPNLPPGIVRTDVQTVRALTYQYSLQAAQAAIDACAATNPQVAVVIVDTAGNPRMIMVTDGAKSGLVEIARRKAFTAAGVRQVTSAEKKLIQANPTMVIPPQSAYLIEPGGVPIRAATQVIGGIGVEGGDPMAAEQCALAGVDKLKDILLPVIPPPNAPRPNGQAAGAPAGGQR